MLFHAFPLISVNSLREFPENCVYNLNCFIEYLQRKLFTANNLSYDIANAKNMHLLDLHIKTINFLFYNYIHVFNSSQKLLNIFVQISYFLY